MFQNEWQTPKPQFQKTQRTSATPHPQTHIQYNQIAENQRQRENLKGRWRRKTSTYRRTRVRITTNLSNYASKKKM